MKHKQHNALEETSKQPHIKQEQHTTTTQHKNNKLPNTNNMIYNTRISKQHYIKQRTKQHTQNKHTQAHTKQEQTHESTS